MASARKNRYSSVTLFLNALDGEDESTEFTEAANGQEVAPSEPTIQNTSSSPKTASRKSHRSNRFLWIALIVVGIVVSVGGPSLLVKSCDRTPDSNNEDTALPADSVVAVEEAKVVEVVQNRTLSTALGECSYSGEVDENGKPNGHGVAVWTKGDGKKYDGEWVNGNMEGQTTYTQRSGDMFVGAFKNNRYHQGRYTIISSGEYFEGTFKNGQPDKGNWYDKNGKKL